MNTSYHIRRMSRKELDTAVSWAAAEGWNPGLHDADAFYAIDPQGFFMGFLEEEPISCISAVSYGGIFGFLGLYIVKPQHRRLGYGIKIWNEAINYLGDQNIGLDGVVAQQDNYKKSGFTLFYNNARYQLKSQKNNFKNAHIVPLSKISFDTLYAYDKQFFPADRKKFLMDWTGLPESKTLVYTSNNEIKGYGMIRKCQTGYKIGPLFADDLDIANGLFLSLINTVSNDSQILLDIPEINKSAIKLVNKNGMTKGFSTARMYTKSSPKLPFDKIFGITTFEVG
jgi:hypothetical protein